jgi:hypothetical protein
VSALLKQVEELLSEHGAAFSYGTAKGCRCMGCWVYLIAIEDEAFEALTFSEAVSKAWSYVCMNEKAKP